MSDTSIKDVRHLVEVLDAWSASTADDDLYAHADLIAGANESSTELPFETAGRRRHLLSTIARCRVDNANRETADKHFVLALSFLDISQLRASHSKEVVYSIHLPKDHK